MKKYFRNSTKIALVLVYLVIVAGATVRMTGSGMGCPDWPKCFGYLIPPTEHSQLEWHPHKLYKKGQVIIVNETLQVAKTDFASQENFDNTNWEKYTKHDYAKFNPYHTWTEFINRLIGALAGIAVLIMAIFSFSMYKEHKVIPILSWLTVIAMGFQAWLGATVVYSVLLPVKITLHMVVALLIVAMILYILHVTRKNNITSFKFDRSFTWLLILAALCTVIQIVLGTQVRQFVDEQIKTAGEHAKNMWLAVPNIPFYIHRSFSILVLLVNILLFMRNKKRALGYFRMNWVVTLIIIEIFTGILMYYVNFPFGSQLAHMLIASILFGIQFYLILDTRKAAKS
ncbi:heme A synthase [Zhouia sp. PK063]|uniref:heme A synthase n=1 Tax=Zhouia sp. PK063 TaxID=3373602 RepID=UPI0037A92D90